MDPRSPTLQQYVASGDHHAFRALVEEYQRMVYVTCQRILARCPAEVDDAVQETFLKLARAAPTIESNLGAWLHACARTTALNRLRAQRLRDRREVDIEHAPLAVPDASSSSVESGEELEIVEDCVGELPTAERELVLSYYYLGQTQQQIADRLGVSQVAIQKRLKSVLEALRHRCVRRGVAIAALALALENSSHAAMSPSLASQLATMPLPTLPTAAGSAGSGIGPAAATRTSSWLIGTGATVAVATIVAALWGSSTKAQALTSDASRPPAAPVTATLSVAAAPSPPPAPVAATPRWPAAISLNPHDWTCTLVGVEPGVPTPGSPTHTPALHLKFTRAFVPGVAVCPMPHLTGDFAIECEVHTRSITCPFSSIWCEPVLEGHPPLLQPVQPTFLDVTAFYPVGSIRHARFEFRRQGADLEERVLVDGQQLLTCSEPQAPPCTDRLAVRTVDGDVDITHLVVLPLPAATTTAPVSF